MSADRSRGSEERRSSIYELILRGARLGEETMDVAVDGGRIARISTSIDERAEREIEANGRLVSPPFIESHVHLDTTLTAGDPRWNESGTLFEGIQIWSERKKSVTHEGVMARATKLLRWQAAQGVLHVRTHVDTTDPELTGLKAMLEVRESRSSSSSAANPPRSSSPTATWTAPRARS